MAKARPGFDPRAAASLYGESLTKNAAAAEKEETPSPSQTVEDKAAAPQPIRNDPRPKKSSLAGAISLNYQMAEAINVALDICAKQTGRSRSDVVNEAVRNSLDKRYFEAGETYAEIKAAFERGESPDSVPALKKGFVPIARSTKKYDTIEGKTVTVCIMTAQDVNSAVEMKARESGLTRGAVLDEALRPHLADYMQAAEEWLARAKAFGIF